MGNNEFPRALFGYRRGPVDAAIAGRDQRLAELQMEVTRLAELESALTRLTDAWSAHEGELRTLRGDLEATRADRDRLRAEHYESVRALEHASARLEEIEAQARGQATRIRMKALREAVEVSDRVAELIRLRDEMSGRLRTALEETASRLSGFEGGAAVHDLVEKAGLDMGTLEQARRKVSNAIQGNGVGEASAAEIFEGLVRVEIGPLDDFSQLVSFEDAAGEISATSEISIERFSEGRATLSMRLDEPVELLRELEERAPFEFSVRATAGDRLVLDVDAEDEVA